jgi:hypothetical protein
MEGGRNREGFPMLHFFAIGKTGAESFVCVV